MRGGAEGKQPRPLRGGVRQQAELRTVGSESAGRRSADEQGNSPAGTKDKLKSGTRTVPLSSRREATPTL
jgi:hypothetical protein